MQTFVGGQNELALVTLLQNSAKITKIRQTEDILGKFALQASLHPFLAKNSQFLPKNANFCRWPK